VRGVAFSADDRHILTGGDQTMRLWDAANDKEVAKYQGSPAGVTQVAFVPHSEQVLCTGANGVTRLWNIETREEIRQFKGHQGEIVAAQISSDGRRLLTGGLDHTLRLWKIKTGKELFAHKGHTYGVQSIAFAPGGRQLVSGGGDNTVRLWNVGRNTQIPPMLDGFVRGVPLLAVLPDGRSIFTCGGDLTVRLWDLDSKGIAGTYRWAVQQSFTNVGLSPDGTQILGTDNRGYPAVYKTADGSRLRTFEPTPLGNILWLQFSADGRLALFGCADWTVRVWDAKDGREVRRCAGPTKPILSASFSPDSRQVYAISTDHKVWRWDLFKNTDTEMPELEGAKTITMRYAW
jgi:WD40 repeat protein